MIPIFLFLQFLFTGSTNDRSYFQPQTIDSNVSIGYGLALGDVDGDKQIDILLADKKQFVWYRNGDWKKFVMAENLTENDNVCIAAEDIDGDGRVEVAVGAQWNPAETKDEINSGSVHYLVRPDDPTQMWKSVQLYHEVTIHRMRWAKGTDGKFYLAVLPLHGKDNTAASGVPVNLLLYRYPELLQKSSPTFIVNTSMHATHNLELFNNKGNTGIYVAGKEGVSSIGANFSSNSKPGIVKTPGTAGAGEIRTGRLGNGKNFIATIEPMHGNTLAVYADEKRQVLDTSLSEGHALAAVDVLGLGYDQVIAGWRRPDKNGQVGIRLYIREKTQSGGWHPVWIDENGIACEDLQVRDLNKDGKPDIVAAGRATRNLKIYWNISAGSGKSAVVGSR